MTPQIESTAKDISRQILSQQTNSLKQTPTHTTNVVEIGDIWKENGWHSFGLDILETTKIPKFQKNLATRTVRTLQIIIITMIGILWAAIFGVWGYQNVRYYVSRIQKSVDECNVRIDWYQSLQEATLHNVWKNARWRMNALNALDNVYIYIYIYIYIYM